MGSGGYVRPGTKSLDPLSLNYWQKQGIDIQAFLTEGQGKVVDFPSSPGIGDSLTEVDNDLGPVYFGTESASKALRTAQADANYALRTG